MANDMNTVNLIGRVTRDTELKYTNSGLAVGSVSIAVNLSEKHGDKWEDVASFFEVKAFGKQIEAIARYMTKGQQVGITGKLKQERWEKDGQKQSRVVIIADNIQLLAKPASSDSHPQTNPQTKSRGEQAVEFEDDLPF